MAALDVMELTIHLRMALAALATLVTWLAVSGGVEVAWPL